MASNCSICMHDWNPDRPPLVLECGHTFCRLCISQIISGANAPECPLCQTLIKYSSCENIPKNYMLLSKEINGEPNTVHTYEKTTPSEPLCTTHDLKLDKWCKTCKRCVCSSCSSDDQSSHPPSTCEVIDFELNDAIEASLDLNAILLKSSQDMQKKINQCDGFLLHSIVSTNQKLRRLHNFKQATEKTIPYIKRVKSKLSSLTEEFMTQSLQIGKSNNTSEITAHFERQKTLKRTLDDWMDTTSKELPIPVNVRWEEITGIVNNFYAVVGKAKLLFGRVKIDGSYMNIGSFKDICPPFNSKIIELSDICPEEKFKKEKNVYLRITADEYDRMISIKLHENNENADVFFSLCCGLEGENYEGCQLVKSDNGLQSTGDFTQMFKEISHNIRYPDPDTYKYMRYNQCKRHIPVPAPPHCSKGDLIPSTNMNQILICTNNSLTSSEVFGKIVEPLESIDYIYDNKCPVSISDCGVIFKC